MLPSSDSNHRFVCVCEKYGLGRPHTVSKSTWYQHIQQASTQEEKVRIRAAEALHLHGISYIQVVSILPPHSLLVLCHR
jgi:hypothetical protein